MKTQTVSASPLAILGGLKAVPLDHRHLIFPWPIVTAEDEQAVVQVMRAGAMSGTNITREFEKEWAEYLGVAYALGHPSGTSSMLSCMFACGVGRGDEVITPSLTYWATSLQCFSLGATPVFADIEPDTLCIDPDDIEHRITPRTKAIIIVHYCGHPVDMDPVMAIARKHKLKVIEDVSHAHGGRYKGRMLGTIGDCSGFSMMTFKSFAIGEAGMFCTNDRVLYERAMAFGHYERCLPELTEPSLKAWAGPAGFSSGLPMGGYKHRMNQTCAAMGLVQLKHYEERMKGIQDGMNRFWDFLEGCPGVRPHRPNRARAQQGTTMGGWYNPLGHYVPEELGGLPVERFIEAVNAEGGRIGRGCNFPLHLHPLLNEADIYGDGKPTRIAFTERDVRQGAGSLPVTERLASRCFGVPWFKRDVPEEIEAYAGAYRKVATSYSDLLKS
jgi:perosamine synthetase